MDPPKAAATAVLYEFGPFRLDPAGRVLLRADRIVPLPPKVLDTLVLLIERRGELVTKDELLAAIWPDTYVDQNSLMHNISVLRKVLGDAPDGKRYIETAPRRGYRFVGEVRIGTQKPAYTSGPIRVGSIRGPMILGGGVLLAAIVAAAMWIKPAAAPVVITPLTSYPGTEAYPAFSPDGRQVAFVWNGEKQDEFDIYVKTLGVDLPTRLTADPESECQLAWSPDGRWLAFTYCGSTEPNTPEGDAGLYIMPSTGGAKRRIGSTRGGGSPSGRVLTWSPDSKAVVGAEALGGRPGAGLFLIPTEPGGARRQLTRPPQGFWESDPAVSPDGRHLAFVRWMAHGLADIYMVRLGKDLAPEAAPSRITFVNDFVTNLLWTNDGSELLYVAGNEGSRGVWRVRAHGGSAPRQVPALAQAGLHMTLSRDGKLAYSRRYWDFDLWRAALDEMGGPRNPGPLISSTFSDDEPRYSPDGKSIAFQSNRTGAMEIWRSDVDGSRASQITTMHAEAGSPAWSPDGSEIAFDCRVQGNVDIYVAAVRDGKLRRVTTDHGIHTTPAWSRDGKWIYFASKRTGRLEIWRIPVLGGDAVQVTQNGGFFAAESLDGKFLFYSRTGDFPTTLWRKSLDTGTEEQIIDSLSNWFSFSVFANGIYFIPHRSPQESVPTFQLAFYDLSNGAIRTLGRVDKWYGVGFSVSPDRRSLLFAPAAVHEANLMLVENFR